MTQHADVVRVIAGYIQVPKHWVCVCGHMEQVHTGPLYATATGSEGHGCDLCRCAYFARLYGEQSDGDGCEQ